MERETPEPERGYPSDEVSPEPSPTPKTIQRTISVNESPPDAAVEEFRQGYRDGRGPPELEDHFVYRVLPCEAGTNKDGSIDWTPGNSGYRSAAQFHPASWATAEHHAGRSLRFESPYDVGLAVAIWIQLIGKANIATTSGWPICGR